MRKCLVILTVLSILLSFVGCREKPRILLDDEYLQITQTGGKIDVYDVLGDNVYNFRLIHKKPSNRVLEPYTAVNSDTLLIEQRHKEIILTVKKCKNKYTLRIGKIFPIISVKKGVYDENFR